MMLREVSKDDWIRLYADHHLAWKRGQSASGATFYQSETSAGVYQVRKVRLVKNGRTFKSEYWQVFLNDRVMRGLKSYALYYAKASAEMHLAEKEGAK